jgi:hypothetical protein
MLKIFEMMFFFMLKILKYFYRFIFKKSFLNPICEFDRQLSNDIIYDSLIGDKPILISRFGTTEIITINNYLVINSNVSIIKKILNYITDNTHLPWWNSKHIKDMNTFSGIFPETKENANEFSKVYLNVIPEIDILGSFQYYEKYMPLKHNVIKVQLEMLYPFFVANPWTRILSGKKVLVVHPFVETIKTQYEIRNLLFEDPNILPTFNLITYKPVQSIGGNPVEFKSWNEALNFMLSEILKLDFDIALVGCGAYGLPLSAHIKSMGKSAIHIGGGLQLFFGILGKRWVKDYEDVWKYRPNVNIDTNYRKLINKNWIYPLETDSIPKLARLGENSYWK